MFDEIGAKNDRQNKDQQTVRLFFIQILSGRLEQNWKR
jgi:hypothetical protein